MISWIVVECSGVGEKCGGPVALPPRRDVAYFVDEKTAERDARAFAEYKNAQKERGGVELLSQQEEPRWHLAYEWDHPLFSPMVRWGVLEWNGESGKPGLRLDVGYFLDFDTAESDAKWFSRARDQWLVEWAGRHPQLPARRVG